MTHERPTPERLGAFSDGVFAVIITIMVLQLKVPEHPTFAALGDLEGCSPLQPSSESLKTKSNRCEFPASGG